MKIIPTQNYILVRMHDISSDSDIQLPEGLQREPYGEVVLCGPECKFTKPGQTVLFHPLSIIGFDKGGDARYIVSEGSVFAICDPEVTQDGHTELKIVKNSPEENHAND